MGLHIARSGKKRLPDLESLFHDQAATGSPHRYGRDYEPYAVADSWEVILGTPIAADVEKVGTRRVWQRMNK